MRTTVVRPGAAVGVFVAICVSGCIETTAPSVERGSIISALPTDQEGENSGSGAVAGLVVGVAVGAVIGGQGGRVVGAAAGGLVGGITGSAAERAGQSATGVAYTIKLLDGRVVTVVEHRLASDPWYAAGSSVGVETRGRTQHVVREPP